MRPGIGEDLIEVRVLFVHCVDHDDLRDAALIREMRNAFGANADAVLCMDHCHREGRQRAMPRAASLMKSR
jgi:hypothetical protein